MTQTSWPFENADTTETQYSYLFDRLKSSGVAGFPTDTALKVTGDGSGMNAKTAAGFAIVRGFMYYSDAIITNTIAVSSANPRIDLVILRLDPTLNTVVQAVLTGSPGTSPSAPALTQTTTGVYEIEIGRVTVPALATTIANSNVTDTRNCLSHGVGIWTADSRPTNPTLGRLGWSTTNQVLEIWTGSAWKEAAPNNINASTITSGILPSSRLNASLNPSESLVIDSGYNIIGTPAPQILQVFFNNPTVGSSFGSTGADLTISGNKTYAITFTSHAIDTDTNICSLFANLTVGSTTYTYASYIPNGSQGQVTATRYLVVGSVLTTTSISVRLKATAGSRNVNTSIVVVGMN